MKNVIKHFINHRLLIRNPISAILNNKRGFTLIELAIVMVIIGIILGAVLKGQDLINNARAKKFVTSTKAWEVSVWSYFDRKGYFPGDSNNKNGKIGGGNFKADLIAASFTNPPYVGATGSEVNTISLGSFTFYIYLGTDAGDDAGKNVMNICVAVACATAFTTDELLFVEALDVSVDGTADGTAGVVIGEAAAPDDVTNIASWEVFWTAPPTAAAYTAGTTTTVVYYFDAKP